MASAQVFYPQFNSLLRAARVKDEKNESVDVGVTKHFYRLHPSGIVYGVATVICITRTRKQIHHVFHVPCHNELTLPCWAFFDWLRSAALPYWAFSDWLNSAALPCWASFDWLNSATLPCWALSDWLRSAALPCSAVWLNSAALPCWAMYDWLNSAALPCWAFSDWLRSAALPC